MVFLLEIFNSTMNRFSRKQKQFRRSERDNNIKTFLCRVRSLYRFECSVRLWKIFIEEIFITFWNICCALEQIWQATRGFDDAKCYSRDSTALRWVELVRTRSEYHESSYIPHRGDWEIQAWFMSCLANVMNML